MTLDSRILYYSNKKLYCCNFLYDNYYVRKKFLGMRCKLIAMMIGFKIFRILFIGMLLALFFQIISVSNYHAFSNTISRQAVPRYFEDKFEINIPALPTQYDNVSLNLEDVDVEVKDTKLVITNLVPDQVYNNVEIIFYDNIGRKYEIILDNVITSQPTKSYNKFVYDVYANGLGRKPDHSGFKFWFNNLSSFNITAVDFVKEMVKSNEFVSVYNDDDEKINALYKTILGREADEEGFNFWKEKYLNLIYKIGFESRQAILEIVDEMVKSDEFRNIVMESGFLYSV